MDSATPRTFGEHLRHWRLKRRMSQLELAGAAGVSTRHLSCLETGRAEPSRAMLLRLCGVLEVPLRERNTLLVAAGFAPLYRAQRLDEDGMGAAREAIERILAGHAPYPALAVDRHWHLLSANRAAMALMEGVDPALLVPPVNVLRLSLHPSGLAPRIANLGEWRAHVLERLRHQQATTLDPFLAELAGELEALCPGEDDEARPDHLPAGIAVPLRLRVPGGVLSFLSTSTVFGTPLDITLAELAIEAFFPADAATAAALQAAHPAAPPT